MRLRATRLTAIAHAVRRAFPRNSATDWYFAQNGLVDTPWSALTRTGLGTRIGPDGLVGYGPHNLLLQSRLQGATAGSPGTVPSPWALDAFSGQISAVESDGVTFSAANQRIFARQSLTVSANTQYSVTLVVRSNSTGRAFISLLLINYGLAGATSTRYANGNLVSSSYVPVAGDRIEERLSVAATGGSIDVRVGLGCSANDTGSVKLDLFRMQVGADSGAADDLSTVTTTAARYLPRITHDPVTLAASLLVEGQGTNLLGQANDFAAWSSGTTGSGSIVKTADAATGPDGQPCDQIAFTAPGAGSTSFIYSIGRSVTNASKYTAATYIKAATLGDVGKSILWRHAGASSYATITVPATWTRVISTETAPLTFTTTLDIGLAPTFGGSTGTVTVLLSSGDWVLGEVVGSHIPNSGTGTAVRAADDWYLSGADLNAAIPDKADFSLVFDYAGKPAPLFGDPFVAFAFNTAAGGWAAGSALLLRFGADESVNLGDASGNVYIYGQLTSGVNRVGLSVKGGRVVFCVNGSSVVQLPASDYTGAGVGRMRLLGLVAGVIDSGAYVLKSCRARPGLSDAALQALTA